LWKNLRELFLCNRFDVAYSIENNGPAAGGTLIKGEYILIHAGMIFTKIQIFSAPKMSNKREGCWRSNRNV
jgi:hypothetical protein